MGPVSREVGMGRGYREQEDVTEMRYREEEGSRHRGSCLTVKGIF